jgi:hypothetical protein
MKRIWIGDHPEAPVPGSGGLVEAAKCQGDEARIGQILLVVVLVIIVVVFILKVGHGYVRVGLGAAATGAAVHLFTAETGGALAHHNGKVDRRKSKPPSPPELGSHTHRPGAQSRAFFCPFPPSLCRRSRV